MFKIRFPRVGYKHGGRRFDGENVHGSEKCLFRNTGIFIGKKLCDSAPGKVLFFHFLEEL